MVFGLTKDTKCMTVEANQEYKDLMLYLSDLSSKKSCTKTTWQVWHCHYLSILRRMNKLRGLPSTKTVGTLATLIIQLSLTIENQLGPGSKRAALPTTPPLPGLTTEDVEDAMEFAGLSTIATHKHIGIDVWETSAAFAATGQGLCKNYTNCDACEQEEADMPFERVLAVSFSRRAFSAAYTSMQSAYMSWHNKDVLSFSLGLENLPQNKEEQVAFWGKIRDGIVDVGRVSPRPLTRLLLLGDEAHDARFLEVMRDALGVLIPEFPGSRFGFLETGMFLDPLYVTARGAAEFAKRAQEAPASCREPSRCQELRGPVSGSGQKSWGSNEEL
ncbi:hypothetical protein G7Y89_g6777 [Cudoniella acicularis]|uniref:Uncharacterized protein n=1 Tax=Cudoniella acicularis TaxID=354080 RepID=A0A8H4W2J3_9HELO|nr:hypothetical protein G7Y89_g6777 [Cudoniella acicularis]